MKTLMVALAAAGFLVAPVSINSLSAQQTDPQPTCRMCEGTYLPATEIQDYLKKALAEKRTDQQARDVDIGKAHVGIGVVYRGKLDAPAPDSVAEHDLVSEVYYIMSGSGTLVLGPDITNMKRRPAEAETVARNAPQSACAIAMSERIDMTRRTIIVVVAVTLVSLAPFYVASAQAPAVVGAATEIPGVVKGGSP